MKNETNINTLKANRQFTITELTRVFKYEAIELKDLMCALIDYTNDCEVNSTSDIKWFIDGMHSEFVQGSFSIVNNGTNVQAMDSKLEEIKSNNVKQSNLYN